MTVIAGTLRPGSQGLLTAGCLAVTPVVAYAAVVSPLLTLLLAAAAILVVATMANLTYGLAIFTTLTFFERLPSLPGSGAAKPMGFVLVVSWLLVLWRSRGQRPFLPRDRRALGFLVLAFVGWAAMSSLWALDAGAAAAGVVRLTLAVALFFVVYTALQTPRDLMTITWTFLTGAWVVSVLSIVTGANKAGRLEAGELDPNFLAATLIVAFTVALFLVWGAGRTRHHVLLVIFMVTYLYAVALTQSRGGLLAGTFALVGAIIFGGAVRSRITASILVVTAVALGYFLLFAPSSFRERFETSSTAPRELRLQSWQIATEIAKDHPLAGVGWSNFADAQNQYFSSRLDLPGATKLRHSRVLSHNTYLELLSELGVVGLGLFTAVLVATFVPAVVALHGLRSSVAASTLAGRGFVVGTAGLLLAYGFESAIYAKHLWLLLGVIAAVPTVVGAHVLETSRLLPDDPAQVPARVALSRSSAPSS